MGADNWRTCPRCLLRAQEAWRDLKALQEAAYGKVSAPDYLALTRKVEAGVQTPPDTLREDYELGTYSDGMFEVSYAARCDCGFKHSFTHKQKIEIKA
jgi:hypothetical protein